MKTSVAELKELIQRARAKDHEALGKLLDLHRPYLRVIAQRLLDRRLAMRLDASDLIQQTCLSVHKRIHEFAGNNGQEFLAWLRQIHERNIQNAVRNHLHAQKRAISREILADPDDLQKICASFKQPTPSQRILAGESVLELTQALEQLPDDQREAVRLRYIEGWPLAAIGIELGRSREAVAGLLKRGLQTLRKALKSTTP